MTEEANPTQPSTEAAPKKVTPIEVAKGAIAASIVTGKQIGRASCRERVSSPV